MVDVPHHLPRLRDAVRRYPVPAASAITGVAVVWFVARLAAPAGPVHVGWLPGLVTVMLSAGVCFSTARRPGVARTVAQFWSAMAVASIFVAVGTVLRTLHSLDSGTGARTVAVPEMVAYLLALVVIGWALCGRAARSIAVLFAAMAADDSPSLAAFQATACACGKNG